MSTFYDLMTKQIANEFTASQQYLAMAVYADGHDLPQLAARFYAQAVEERNHSLMFVQYMLDRDIDVSIPGVAPVSNTFDNATDAIAQALANEKQVTSDIEQLFAAARAENDALGEQFMLWFLKEQVEEVATMTTLLAIAKRAGENLFQLEEYLARETTAEAVDASAPPVAGGAL